MKILVLVSLMFSSLAQAYEVDPKVKQLIFDEISSLVYFEDEGEIRAPSQVEDFEFTIVDEQIIKVTGESYSNWDMKLISYDCQVEILTKGEIKGSDDLAVSCDLKNENWPYWN